MVIAEALFDFGESNNFRVLLEDTSPQTIGGGLRDPKVGAEYTIIATCRKLGEDNGKDQLVDISDLMKSIREYMRNAYRKPTKEEHEIFLQIISNPMG